MGRSKIYPTEDQLRKLGFEHKGQGYDPRDFWWEMSLKNDEFQHEVTLELDAYFDFSLNIPELTDPIPLNFQSVEEIEIFSACFKRPWNHAFTGFKQKLNNAKKELI